MQSLIERASAFARNAHGSQKRKYTNEPYFTHCAAVAAMVQQNGGSVEAVAAGFLHDVVEDTDITIKEIGMEFGLGVAELVYDLTDHFTKESYPEWNRAKRKYFEAKRLGTVSEEAKLIKWCDLADNTKDIVTYDPGFAKVYLKEKAVALEEMGF